METTKEFIDFKGTITVDVFAKLYKNAPQVQDSLHKFDRKIALILGGSMTYYGEEGETEEQTVEDVAEANRIRDLLMTYEADLDQTTDIKNRRKLMGQITTESRALERIESRLGRRDSSDILLGKTEFQTNRMHANGLVKVAEELGEWFATGAAGPGTVTFRGKTYTAQ